MRFLDKFNENLMKILNTLPRPVFAKARAASHYTVPCSMYTRIFNALCRRDVDPGPLQTRASVDDLYREVAPRARSQRTWFALTWLLHR